MQAKDDPSGDPRIAANQRVKEAIRVFRRQKRYRAGLLLRRPTDVSVRRANHRVWWSASRLVQTVELYRPLLGSAIAKDALAGMLNLPPPKYCECGCRGFVPFSRTGRPPRFASTACRKRAYRRRRVGLPEDAPKTKPGGRTRLSARLTQWLFSRERMANVLVHQTQVVREEMRRRHGLTSAQLRNHLWRLRIEAGLRPSPLAKIRLNRYSTRSLQI